MGDPGPSAAGAAPGGGEIPPGGPAQEEADKDEEEAEAQEVPRRRHPKMPTAREVEEHEDQAHA
eukprot:5312815-Pyramimonas_sp.AAC.1